MRRCTLILQRIITVTLAWMLVVATLFVLGCTETVTTTDIQTPKPPLNPPPKPTVPSEDIFQNKPSLDKTGAVQIKATFKTAPGVGRYYTLLMYDSKNLIADKSIAGTDTTVSYSKNSIADKSITGTDTTISFGIADGLEVPKTEATKKDYRFIFLQIENNIVRFITSLADTVAVYDDTSTAPPAPKDAKLSVVSATQTTATAVYEFSAGDITTDNKAPNGSKLTQAQIQYKVYIAEGDHSTKTIDVIKTLAGVETQKQIRELAGKNTTRYSVSFIGKRDATYTVGVEAINSLSPAYSIGASGTIITKALTPPPTTPKITTYTSNNAVVFSVPSTGGNTGKKVITVQVNASAIAGMRKADGTPLEATDLAYYVLYLKKEDSTGKPDSVSALWAVEKSHSKVAVRVAKYTKATGMTNQATVQIPIVDSTSGSNAGATPIETAKDYYIGVRIVNTTSPDYDASNSDRLFPAGFYTDITEIKEVYTSKAVAPNRSLLTGKLVLSQSSTAGKINLRLTQLSTFTGAKDYDGKDITADAQLVYTVYGLQKDTIPTVAEVLAGRKVNIGSASSGVYTVPALMSLGLSSDTAPVIAIKGATKYHFVLEVAIKADLSKKVASSSVASIITVSLATAPAEVRNIQTRTTPIGMRVSWTAPSLSANHKADTGDALITAQVSYKVYSIAKSGSARSATAIKQADSSPTTVGAGTTNTTLTGLINGTTYEIVVQAVNSTDTTKTSTGERHEFEMSAVIIGNTMEVSAEVGKAPRSAHSTRRLVSSPSGVAFTCDANIREGDSKKIKEETGLALQFEQSSKTITISGIANKSNVHDLAITNYSYDVVQCTITASNKRVPASIIIKTGLKAAPSGETSPTYYRPTTKKQLKAIISAERGARRQNTNSPNLNMIDTSAITDMSNLFDNDSTFNGDITQWNTSNVRSMFSMFTRASAFNQDIGNWNVSNVRDMFAMFNRANIFDQDIGNWNVRNVNSFAVAFEKASAFDQDLSSWRLCKVFLSSYDFSNSAMAGKTTQYPKDINSKECKS